jgi:signal transduction histidine kinase
VHGGSGAIFGLRAKEAGRSPQGLRARAAACTEEATRTLGFAPALRMEGLLDTDVPPAVTDDAVAMLTEALSNAARHARASAVEVTVAVARGTLTVTVTDDGVGLPPDGRRSSGLANLAARARRLNGTLETGAGPVRGTRLVWTVPLAPSAAG